MTGEKARDFDRRTVLKYAGVAGTGTLLAGCTGDGEQSDETTTTTDTTTGTEDEETTTEEETGDPEGTDFVYATTITPNSLDPMKASDNLDTILAHNLYDPLLYYSAGVPPELKPWLAKDWNVASDKKTYSFTLREDATFHNGDPVTAEDVVYSVKRMLNMQRGLSWMWSDLLSTENVEATGDYTLEMTLDRVFAPFQFTLPYMFVVNKEQVEANTKSSGEFGEHGDYGTEWLEENDAGAGPYELASRERKQSIEFEKNTDWWGSFADGNTYETVRTDMVPEPATIVGMVNEGSADMSDQWLSLQSYEELADQEEVSVSRKATFNPFYIFMHTQREPLNDIHVRKAISYAFDYETALDGVLSGDSQQLKGPLPSAMWGHSSDVKVYEQDMEQAQAHLDQSEYSADEIELNYTYVTGLTIEQNHGLLLQTNLNELGITLNVQKKPWTKITEQVTNQESTPDMLAVYLSFRYADPDVFLYPAWHTSSHGSWTSPAWYENDRVDELLSNARRVIDKQERAGMYEEAQEIIAEDAPALFVANQATRYGLNDRVQGFTDNGVTGYVQTFHRFTEQSG